MSTHISKEMTELLNVSKLPQPIGKFSWLSLDIFERVHYCCQQFMTFPSSWNSLKYTKLVYNLLAWPKCNKENMLNLVTYLNWLPILSGAWLCVSKNGYQKDMFERDWTACSKYVNHFRSNSQHNFGDLFDCFMAPTFLTLEAICEIRIFHRLLQKPHNTSMYPKKSVTLESKFRIMANIKN